jgi:exodeoxyribonuclease-5
MDTLSEDQETACQNLIQSLLDGSPVMVLTGPAGTGKTTLTREFSRRVASLGWKTKFLAPTGKAAVRISEVTGEPASTIHSALYRSVLEGKSGQLVFANPRPPCLPKTVLIIDEASMIDTSLDEEIRANLPKQSSILYVGDREQIPPVHGSWGPNFDQPTAILTEIHRQALDNPIIQISKNVREGKTLPKGQIGNAYFRRAGSLYDVSQWMLDHEKDDCIVLCWTNQTRQALNKIFRRNLGFDKDGIIVPGDRLIVLNNNKRLGKMNGEIGEVTKITPFLETRTPEEEIFVRPPTSGEIQSFLVELDGGKTRAFVNPKLLDAPYMLFSDFTKKGGIRTTQSWQWLHMAHGRAITIHKSQGSQYQNVAAVIDKSMRRLAKQDPNQARRLIYTAITRTISRLDVFDFD